MSNSNGYPMPLFSQGHPKEGKKIWRDECYNCREGLPMSCAGFYPLRGVSIENYVLYSQSNVQVQMSPCGCGCPWHQHKPSPNEAETIDSNRDFLKGACTTSSCQRYFSVGTSSLVIWPSLMLITRQTIHGLHGLPVFVDAPGRNTLA